MNGLDRAAAMARRLDARAARAGWRQPDRLRLAASFELALAPRRERLDPTAPQFLHPGRTALILFDDARLGDAPAVICAGAVCETLDPELRVGAAAARARLDPAVADLADAVPRPDREGERLLEALLAAPHELRCIALAERLDHARHWHLRPRPEWRSLALETAEVYLPLARRTDDRLARRLAWWVRRVGGG